MAAPREHVAPDPNHTDLDVGTGRFVYVKHRHRGLPVLMWRIRTSKMRPILLCFRAPETTDDRFNPRVVGEGGRITSYISWEWRKINRGGVWVHKYVRIIAATLYISNNLSFFNCTDAEILIIIQSIGKSSENLRTSWVIRRFWCAASLKKQTNPKCNLEFHSRPFLNSLRPLC